MKSTNQKEALYCDLCLNYDNTNNTNLEKYKLFSELLVSAMCDGFNIIGINFFKKGNLNNNDVKHNFSIRHVGIKIWIWLFFTKHTQ